MSIGSSRRRTRRAVRRASVSVSIAAIASMAGAAPAFADGAVLRRESGIEVGTLPALAYLTMLEIALTLLALLGWGIWRVGQPDDPDAGRSAGPDANTGRGQRPRRPSKDTGGAPVNPRAA